jgi:hypothetical protein
MDLKRPRIQKKKRETMTPNMVQMEGNQEEDPKVFTGDSIGQKLKASVMAVLAIGMALLFNFY